MPAIAEVLSTLTRDDVKAEYARRHLRAFIEEAWSIIEAVPFVANWHLDVICDQLEAVTRGELTRVLINVPPGTAKSLITSVFWPAWEWATDPTKRFITASYGQDLATRDSVKMRVLVESPWYQSHWPIVLRGDANQKTRYENEDGGWRLATSVGGRGTGEHPDRVIIDDPHNVKEAESELERQGALDWFQQTISSRGVTRNAAIIVIMQRLNERDLSGMILSGDSAEEWTHVCLPMRAEPASALSRTKAHRPPVDPRQPGDLLWPSLFTPHKVASLERALGSYATAGQLQQRPAPLEGGLLKRGWVQYYDRAHPPTFSAIVLSWDTALKEKEQNDFSTGQAWGIRGADRFLLRRQKGRWDFVDLLFEVTQMHVWAVQTFPSVGITILVENAAAGPDVIRVLRRRLTGVIAFKAKGDKVQRALAAQPVLEAGNIWLPGEPSRSGTGPEPGSAPAWAEEVVDEWASFPNGAHDDDVDAWSQMILHLQSYGAKAGGMTVDWLL